MNPARCFVFSLTVLGAFLLFASPLQAQRRERQFGLLSVNAERGIRISVGNRTTGNITINGWDRNTIEARATSSRGDEVVIFDSYEKSGVKTFFFKADFADLTQPAAPNSRVDSPPEVDGKSFKIHLQLNVPRYVELDEIQVWYSDVQVSDVETAVAVAGDHSKIILKRVGAAKVHTTSGEVEIDGVNELASVVTTTGAIRVNHSKKLILAVSITGPIEVKCSVGRVDVSNTAAPIDLENIDGDVDAIATNSNVRLIGGVREGARYYLKSMSGRVEMLVPSNTRGFEAVLSSYRGSVETDFKFATKQSDAASRRVAGRFGNGKAKILLDSFEGIVRLNRMDGQLIPSCK